MCDKAFPFNMPFSSPTTHMELPPIDAGTSICVTGRQNSTFHGQTLIDQGESSPLITFGVAKNQNREVM
jgi:hypothetical protein